MFFQINTILRSVASESMMNNDKSAHSKSMMNNDNSAYQAITKKIEKYYNTKDLKIPKTAESLEQIISKTQEINSLNATQTTELTLFIKNELLNQAASSLKKILSNNKTFAEKRGFHAIDSNQMSQMLNNLKSTDIKLDNMFIFTNEINQISTHLENNTIALNNINNPMFLVAMQIDNQSINQNNLKTQYNILIDYLDTLGKNSKNILSNQGSSVEIIKSIEKSFNSINSDYFKIEQKQINNQIEKNNKQIDKLQNKTDKKSITRIQELEQENKNLYSKISEQNKNRNQENYTQNSNFFQEELTSVSNAIRTIHQVQEQFKPGLVERLISYIPNALSKNNEKIADAKEKAKEYKEIKKYCKKVAQCITLIDKLEKNSRHYQMSKTQAQTFKELLAKKDNILDEYKPYNLDDLKKYNQELKQLDKIMEKEISKHESIFSKIFKMIAAISPIAIIGHATDRLKKAFFETKEIVSEKTSELTGKISQKAQEKGEKILEKGKEILGKTKEKISDITHDVKEKLGDITSKIQLSKSEHATENARQKS